MTIPWVHPESWYAAEDSPNFKPEPRWVGCNVRRLAGDVDAALPPKTAKYMAVAGSERGHCYPFGGQPAAGVDALVCEGEFDALVAWQEAGWICNVVTFGGAGQGAVHDDARQFLAACPNWLLSFDHDAAGDKAAEAMAKGREHRCRRLYLPCGMNDLSDLHWMGPGSVLDWLRGEYGRFGWPWPGTAGRAIA